MERKVLEKLASQLMIKIADDEINELMSAYKQFMEQVELLDKIDTSDVEPLFYPYEIETTFLRNDHVEKELAKEDVLKNAYSVEDDYIKVVKVIE